MGLVAVVPLAACGGNVVVEGTGAGAAGSGAGDAGGGGNGGAGGQGGAGQGGSGPCVPSVPDGQKLKHVCLALCPVAGETEAKLAEVVNTESCDNFCCTSTYLVTVECGPFIENGQCCFDVATNTSEEICMGRPFMADGHARIARAEARADWADGLAPDTNGVDSLTRNALAAAWAGDALYEHASIASFARFALELLAAGAPPDLIRATQQAMSDEIGHARACFGLASAYGAAPVGPSDLNVGDCPIRTRLADIAEATAREGCIGETLSAMCARAALDGATDPTVRAVLGRIAVEEEAHSALAWRFVAWAVRQGDAETVARVRRVFEEDVRGVPSADDTSAAGVNESAWRAHGRLTANESAAVFRAGLMEVVRPCATALLAAERVEPVAADNPMLA